MFGTLKGFVTSISPDAVLNEESGETFYVVEVQTTEQLRDGNGTPLADKPDFSAWYSNAYLGE